MSEIPREQHTVERITDSTLIRDIPVIEKGGSVPSNRKGLAEIIEVPLLEACQDLYDKNIQTVMSSANQKDVGGEAYIDIDFDSLSDSNKQIAMQLGELFNMHGSKITKCIKIRFPVNRNTTVGDIRRMAQDAVSIFEKQKMTWATRYTIGDLAKIYGIPEDQLNPEDFSDMYYDKETGFLYPSEEHFRKVHNSD